jgi:hypothetical protein
MFQARTKAQILMSMLARFVTRSGVTDIEEGGVPASALGVVAEELEGVDYRQQKMQRAWNFEDAEGQDLDDRLGEMPGGGVPRLGASAATGSAFEVTVFDDTVETIVPAGTVYGRTDDSAVVYVQQAQITIPIGQASYPEAGDTPIQLVASVRGSRSNAPTGTITRVVSGPDNLLSVVNTATISGGVDRETDAAYKERGRLYLGSLAGCQTMALEFLARSFVSEDGVQIVHAHAIEDPTRPGYTELVVDDGSGMLGFSTKGAAVSGRVPLNDPTLIQTILYHQSPGTAPIAFGQFKHDPGWTGTWVDVPLNADGTIPWYSIQERGRLYPPAGLFTPGDGWQITGYNIYTGPIRELQTLVEGVMSDPFQVPGKRASGTRVLVVAPLLQKLLPPGITVQLVVEEGADTLALRDTVEAEIVAFVQSIPPGQPLFLWKLGAKLEKIEGLKNVKFVTPDDDVYPYSERHKLYCPASLVEAI